MVMKMMEHSMEYSNDFDDRELYDMDDPDELESESYINKTYVCEDCDFRWQEKIFPDRNDYPDYEDELGAAHVCPMCGSLNVSFY